MQSKPVGYAVKVKPLRLRTKTAGGIIIADSILEKDQNSVNVGQVLACGSAAFFDWPDKEEVKVGDIVKFQPHRGRSEQDRDGTCYRMIHYDDIYCVEDPKNLEDKYEEVSLND